MKLGLGTAQFGLDYGATNCTGKVSEADVICMLAEAADSSVVVLDTAASYGDAESVLGRCLPRPHAFQVVTKTLPFRDRLTAQENLKLTSDGFRYSLARLAARQVYGLLAHRPYDLLTADGPALADWLLQQRSDGLVQHVGASVYTEPEIFELYDRYPFDLVQLPLNVLDQRMLTSGLLNWLCDRGVEIHIRSTFLQGVLLANPHELAPAFSPLVPHLVKFRSWLEANRVTPIRAALGFIAAACPEATVIFGATSGQELREIVEAARSPWGNLEDFLPFARNDSPLIDPRGWSN